MGERRRSSRLTVKVDCQAVTDEDDDFFLLGDEIVDISVEGLLLRAQGIPALVGEQVIVSFRPPNSSVWIDAAGTIVRLLNGSEPGAPGFGIQLLELNAFDRALLEATIERFSQRRTKRTAASSSANGSGFSAPTRCSAARWSRSAPR